MGPRFCKRGNREALSKIEKEEKDASMGPRFCKRGNIPAAPVTIHWYTLQWGHAFVSVET